MFLGVRSLKIYKRISFWSAFALISMAIGASIAGLMWVWPNEQYTIRSDFEPARSGSILINDQNCNEKTIKRMASDQARDAAKRCNEADATRVTTNDLIQQTRAADASERQALIATQAARVGYFQAVVAVLTLVSAAIAAVYSGYAASLAKLALKDQRESSAATDRPWLCLTVTPCADFKVKQGVADFKVDIMAENIGSRVAQDITCWIEGYQGASRDDFDAAYEKMEENMRGLKGREHKGLRTALPGRSAHFRSPLPAALSRRASLRAIAYVEYKLPNGKSGHSWEAFQFETADHTGQISPISKPTFPISQSNVLVRRVGWSNAD